MRSLTHLLLVAGAVAVASGTVAEAASGVLVNRSGLTLYALGAAARDDTPGNDHGY
jgi:predicted lipoprotein with Yx(FWY)xxD motif